MVLIKPVSEIEPYIKAMVYGDPGIGKTHLAGTAQNHPKMQETLFINIEGGMLTVSGTGADATEQIKSVDAVEKIIWGLTKREGEFAKYNTVVLDSGTELQTISLEGITAKARKKNKNRDREIDDIYLEDYGKSTAQLKRIFRHLRDLPMNVIVTALVRRVVPESQIKGKSKKPTAAMPSFTEKLAGSIMGYMDSVWYMYMEDGKRKMLTQKAGIYEAKTRGVRFSEKLGTVVESPNMAEIYQLLMDTEGGAG